MPEGDPGVTVPLGIAEKIDEQHAKAVATAKTYTVGLVTVYSFVIESIAGAQMAKAVEAVMGLGAKAAGVAVDKTTMAVHGFFQRTRGPGGKLTGNIFLWVGKSHQAVDEVVKCGDAFRFDVTLEGQKTIWVRSEDAAKAVREGLAGVEEAGWRIRVRD